VGHRILETIPAKPGWHAAYADPGGDGRLPVRFEPVVSWAVVDGIPGAPGPEVCPMVRQVAGGLPRLVPLVQGAPGGCPAEFLGVSPPGEAPDAWAERARARLQAGEAS